LSPGYSGGKIEVMPRWFRKRAAGYRAAINVEKHRGDAQALRRDDPALYEEILHQADGSEAEAAAQQDPDAFVALWLTEAERAGVIGPEAAESEEDPAAVFRAHWPEFDVERVWTDVTGLFADVQAERGVGLLYYPKWGVRRFVADQVAWEAARFDPQARADVDEVFSGLESLFDEDAERDERLAAVLAQHHLDGVVEMIVKNLSDEPEETA
jgi:hypothetical protein